MSRLNRRFFVPGPVVAAVMLGFASPAMAATFEVKTTNDHGGANYTYSNSNYKVCDTYPDGLRAVAYLTGTSGTSYIEDADGVYDPTAGNYCTVVNRNLAANTSATLKVCLRNGPSGALQYCRQTTFTVR